MDDSDDENEKENEMGNGRCIFKLEILTFIGNIFVPTFLANPIPSARKRLFVDSDSMDTPLKPKKRSYATQNTQVERAILCQEETNELLKTVVQQNVAILAALQSITKKMKCSE